eukprot:239412-Prorocentrum_minimum.AAC.2
MAVHGRQLVLASRRGRLTSEVNCTEATGNRNDQISQISQHRNYQISQHRLVPSKVLDVMRRSTPDTNAREASSRAGEVNSRAGEVNSRAGEANPLTQTH